MTQHFIPPGATPKVGAVCFGGGSAADILYVLYLLSPVRMRCYRNNGSLLAGGSEEILECYLCELPTWYPLYLRDCKYGFEFRGEVRTQKYARFEAEAQTLCSLCFIFHGWETRPEMH